ncbi:DNA-binding protein [Adlercreutzia sp. ZJ473]|uniref:DNA-binding protein n=1 Tax=Adlercreutzia sp. ZJ473 TaxID=2722822 RepID=UPI0015575FD3|nr:DNA-binding protein [Adlercreutzia sp. ZJ473]
MLHVYEFEVFEGERLLIAAPYDMEGGTQGADFKEVCEMAADWLQIEMEHRAMHGLPFPEATFDNEPRHGGRNIVVAVNAGKETVMRVTAAEAARRLRVTRGRVSQMITAGLLETFELDGRTWVTEHSVEARLADQPRPGRPRKEKVEA